MMGDDGAGALLSQMLHKTPPPGWIVLHGGSAPENILHKISELSPQQIIIFDATDMDLPPGSIRIIPEKSLQNPFFFTTHTLPLTFLIEALQRYASQITFIGIQPDTIAFGYPISIAVTRSIETIYKNIMEDPLGWFDCITILDLNADV